MATDRHPTTPSRRTPKMRVLVAFENVRSSYSRVISRAIRELRQGLKVRSIVLEELERDLVRFDPHVVVCSRPNGTHPTSTRRGAWVHIPSDDGLEDDERLARICLDGEHWRTEGPPLKELLEVLDETHERLREGTLSEVC
jgi:hypothetical protein